MCTLYMLPHIAETFQAAAWREGTEAESYRGPKWRRKNWEVTGLMEETGVQEENPEMHEGCS